MFLGGSIRAKSVLQKPISKFRANREGLKNRRISRVSRRKAKRRVKKSLHAAGKETVRKVSGTGKLLRLGEIVSIFIQCKENDTVKRANSGDLVLPHFVVK